MKDKIVNEKQPFGFVHNVITHPAAQNGTPITSKRLGPTTEIPNHGVNNVVPMVNTSNAAAKAHQNRDNPFAWTGLPVKDK